MGVVKRIVCLANSRKLSERCVAGKEVLGNRFGSWIRPVSKLQRGEVSLLERRYSDGTDPCILDVMDVTLAEARPKDYQQENWVLDPSKRWEKVGQATLVDLPRLVDPLSTLWVNDHSTKRGWNDQIPLSLAVSLKTSLRFVRVPKITLAVFDYYEKRRVQGRFQYYGTEHWMWVTDPIYEVHYKRKADGEYPLKESYLTLSLSEPFAEKNACYKLIAAIIEAQGGST